MNIIVLGASNKPERHSNMAVKLLLEKGHTVFPVNPAFTTIYGCKVHARLSDITAPIHTITLYLNPSRSDQLYDDIIAVKPQRVIFNPGAENPALSQRLQAAGISTLDACTLVLLKTNEKSYF